MNTDKAIDSLVLDATPLITQSASALQQYATKFFTTPGVKSELRDENARNQLLLWGDALVVRQPKQVYIDKVSSFAKLTGDYSVLSMNDVHIIALAYEIEYEKNGDKHLRKYPGEKLASSEAEEQKEAIKHEEKHAVTETVNVLASNESIPDETTEVSQEAQKDAIEDDGFQVVTRKQKRPSRKYRWKNSQHTPQQTVSQTSDSSEIEHEPSSSDRISENAAAENQLLEQDSSEITQAEDTEKAEADSAELLDEDEDDDGDWITPGNLQEIMMKDNNETVRDAQDEKEVKVTVAISTGDFACQNVSMQIGLKLMNYTSGKQIKSVKNFMYRCHACFKMVPMPKSGERKHFCPKCGGDTLLRCAVSIDNVTGKVTPHLKSNFRWITKGQVYSIPSPLSKSTQKKQGRAGYQHNKGNRHKDLQEPLILREDQREYIDAVTEDARRRRQNEKMLQEYVGGGSADNIISPFTSTARGSGVRVGRGRNANATKAKRK